MAYPTPTIAASHAYKYPTSTTGPRGRFCSVPFANFNRFAPSSQDFRACAGDISQQPANFPSAASVSPPQNRRVSDLIQDSNYWDDSAMYSYNAHSQSNGNFLDGSSSSLASYSSTDHGVSPATLTVTPNDLFLTPSTFQHTPDSDIFDSPAPLYSNNVSPNFAIQDSPADYGSFDFDANAATKNFFPALPGNDDMQAPPPRPATIDDMQSPLVNSAAMKVSTSMSRTASYQSPVKSPRGPRPSLSSGITKAKPKKRQGKLKDMVVNPDDPTSFKRCRNTLAARNSRARRQQRMEDLEEQVSKWKARAINLGWQDADDEEDLE
ncbi:MAG: hypothetical protein LQ352_001895 [Teloschistes flavicans]|nr:MAG: hypothetical protein LQ352_001895 [Teloschistes flavicans]